MYPCVSVGVSWKGLYVSALSMMYCSSVERWGEVVTAVPLMFTHQVVWRSFSFFL